MTLASREVRVVGRQQASETADLWKFGLLGLGKSRPHGTGRYVCIVRGVECVGYYSEGGNRSAMSFPSIGLEREVRGTAIICLPLFNRSPCAPAETEVHTIAAKYFSHAPWLELFYVSSTCLPSSKSC